MNESGSDPTRWRCLGEAVVVIAVMALPVLLLGLLGETAPPWLSGLVMLLTLPAAGLVAWVWMRAEGTGRRGLGLGPPEGWGRTVALGVGAGLGVLLLASFVVTPLVEAMFGPWLDPAMFDPARGDLQALLVNVLLVSWLHAALFEEVIFRGFLLQRFERGFGGGPLALAAALVLQALLFGLAHAGQGMTPIVATTIGGILWGGIFVAVRRNLWVTMIGHGVMNTTLFVLVYLGQHRLILG